MSHVLKVMRLHLNKAQSMFGVPAQIVGMVLVVTMIISFALQRGGLDPNSADYAGGARMNMGMIWSLPGFLIYYGVQAIATTYPFSLALGATRRAHVFGTACANVLLALFVTALMLVLLGIELATNHWFFGAYALDVYLLGAGDPLVLGITAFLLTFVSLCIGGFFGAVWVRWGTKGPTVVALVLAIVLATLLLIFMPQMREIIAAITGATLAAAGASIALLSLLGTWIVMRRASVR